MNYFSLIRTLRAFPTERVEVTLIYGGLLTQQKSGLSSSLAYGSLTAFFILCFSTSGFETSRTKAKFR